MNIQECRLGTRLLYFFAPKTRLLTLKYLIVDSDLACYKEIESEGILWKKFKI